MEKKVVKNQLNVGSSGTMVNICNYFCRSFRFRVQSGHHLISSESSIGNLSDQDLSLASCMYPGLSVNFECHLRTGSYFLVTILSQHFPPIRVAYILNLKVSQVTVSLKAGVMPDPVLFT